MDTEEGGVKHENCGDGKADASICEAAHEKGGDAGRK